MYHMSRRFWWIQEDSICGSSWSAQSSSVFRGVEICEAGSGHTGLGLNRLNISSKAVGCQHRSPKSAVPVTQLFGPKPALAGRKHHGQRGAAGLGLYMLAAHSGVAPESGPESEQINRTPGLWRTPCCGTPRCSPAPQCYATHPAASFRPHLLHSSSLCPYS